MQNKELPARRSSLPIQTVSVCQPLLSFLQPSLSISMALSDSWLPKSILPNFATHSHTPQSVRFIVWSAPQLKEQLQRPTRPTETKRDKDKRQWAKEVTKQQHKQLQKSLRSDCLACLLLAFLIPPSPPSHRRF
jgi:hypothetical protein